LTTVTTTTTNTTETVDADEVVNTDELNQMVSEIQSKLTEDVEIESKEILEKLKAEYNQNDTLTDISQSQEESKGN
jgi:hypothetical protein